MDVFNSEPFEARPRDAPVFLRKRYIQSLREGGFFLARCVSLVFCPTWRKGRPWLLAFGWCAGLIFGAALCIAAGDGTLSLMRGVIWAPVSIVGSLCVSVLPFLLSAFAVFLSQPGWLMLICFLKSALLAFLSVGLSLTYGSAGWLARLLILSGDWLCMPVLYGFWLRYISGERRLELWSFALWLLAGLLVGSVYFHLIVPFLTGLTEGCCAPNFWKGV